MHQALQYQRDIDTITRLIKPVDFNTYLEMKVELQEKYLTTMQDLFANLLIVANVV
jgi:DNA-binding MurR/RpiR family transcriptional regulator